MGRQAKAEASALRKRWRAGRWKFIGREAEAEASLLRERWWKNHRKVMGQQAEVEASVLRERWEMPRRHGGGEAESKSGGDGGAGSKERRDQLQLQRQRRMTVGYLILPAEDEEWATGVAGPEAGQAAAKMNGRRWVPELPPTIPPEYFVAVWIAVFVLLAATIAKKKMKRRRQRRAIAATTATTAAGAATTHPQPVLLQRATRQGAAGPSPSDRAEQQAEEGLAGRGGLCYPSNSMKDLEVALANRGGGGGGGKAAVGGARSMVEGLEEGEEAEEEEPAVALSAEEPGVLECIEAWKPGDLRKLFLRNLRKVECGEGFETAAAVSRASIAFGGSSRGEGEEHERGSVDGRLEKGMLVGEGSFGRVRVAHHTVLPGEYAVKSIKKGCNGWAAYHALVEMVVFSRLSLAPHPNVLSAVSLDDRERRAFPILLPKADCDLSTAIQRGRSDMSGLLMYVRQVASGVEHLHAHGISHCDIKPSNVLLFPCAGGLRAPRLADFGAARSLGEERPSSVGTLGFMPFECMSGTVPARKEQDVFALAAMALFVCTSQRNARYNVFDHEDLYTTEEICERFILELQPSRNTALKVHQFVSKVTKRVLQDESIEPLFRHTTLDDGLGCKDSVALFLPTFLQKDPAQRPDIVAFQNVVGNFAAEAAEKESQWRSAAMKSG